MKVLHLKIWVITPKNEACGFAWYMNFVDLYGFHVSKYTVRPMGPMDPKIGLLDHQAYDFPVGFKTGGQFIESK